jgi:hypothetical protein
LVHENILTLFSEISNSGIQYRIMKFRGDRASAITVRLIISV